MNSISVLTKSAGGTLAVAGVSLLVGASGTAAAHGGETFHFCSNRCKRSFEDRPTDFSRANPQVSGGASQDHDHH